jgi:hypothetical protein
MSDSPNSVAHGADTSQMQFAVCHLAASTFAACISTGSLVDSPTSPRVLVWSRSSTSTIYASTWNGSSWSSTITGPALPHEALWLRLAIPPTRDKLAIVTLDYDNRVCGFFHQDGAFTSPATLHADTNERLTRPIDVAFESSSGDALAVYGRGDATIDIGYRTATGTTWNAEQTLNLGMTERLRWVGLYPKPSSDQIILAAVDYGDYVRAAVWNGSSFGTPIALSGNSTVCEGEQVGVAYESLSGDAIVVYGNGNSTPRYRTYSAGSWSNASTMAAGGGLPRFVRLVSKPGSDEILCGIQSSNNSIRLYHWNGSAWSNSASATTNSGFAERRTFDVAYTPDGTQGLIVYSSNATTLRYRTWTTSLSAQQSWGVLGGVPQFIQLVPGSSGTHIVAAISGPNWELYTGLYSATSRSPFTMVESFRGGENYSQAFMLAPLAFQGPKITRWTEVAPQ